MRRKIRLSRAVKANRSSTRRLDTNVPAVPTFKPDPDAAVMKPVIDSKTADDPAEEAVRRMVEAAYT